MLTACRLRLLAVDWRWRGVVDSLAGACLAGPAGGSVCAYLCEGMRVVLLAGGSRCSGRRLIAPVALRALSPGRRQTARRIHIGEAPSQNTWLSHTYWPPPLCAYHPTRTPAHPPVPGMPGHCKAPRPTGAATLPFLPRIVTRIVSRTPFDTPSASIPDAGAAWPVHAGCMVPAQGSLVRLAYRSARTRHDRAMHNAESHFSWGALWFRAIEWCWWRAGAGG